MKVTAAASSSNCRVKTETRLRSSPSTESVAPPPSVIIIITVCLSEQNLRLFQEAPLSSVFSQYLTHVSPELQRKVRFHFDGSKVTGDQTPAQLDMEDGDIIEVWT